MSDPIVSVVMSVYNGERFLCEAIESILNQSFRDFEFIIVDDGSTDESPSILDYYENSDPRVRIVRQQNMGLIDALNRGCGLSRGRYIARMDADDIAVSDRLLWQVTMMELYPAIGVLGGAVNFIDTTGKTLNIARYHPTEDRDIQAALLDGNVIWHPTVVIRKPIFDLVGAYRHVADAEDYDLWLRIAELSKVVNLPQVLLKYRVHPEQGSVTRCRKQALGALASRISAIARRSGKPDPLPSLGEVTQRNLIEIGLDEKTLKTTVARGYLACIRNMSQSGELGIALDMLVTLHSSEFAASEKWVIADSYLWAARIHWIQQNFIGSGLNVCRALRIRPIILGRPLKLVVGRLTRKISTSFRSITEHRLIDIVINNGL